MASQKLHLADYWKSQERKFCDFCKCWISSNKPSIQFHENGKKHKENVARRLEEIRTKSAKDHKAKIEVDNEMKKMEEAALKAYLKDIENNPDYTSEVIKNEVAERKAEKERLRIESLKKDAAESSSNEVPVSSSSKIDEENSKKWYEAQSAEGHKYYWHIETGESRWEPPDEGFLSIEDQAKEAEDKLKLEEQKRKEEEEREAERELRKRKLELEKIDEKTSHLPKFGPAPRPARPDPYGSWESIKPPEEPVDLQLPQVDYVELNVPSLVSDQPKFEFKEKTVSNLSSLVKTEIKQEKSAFEFKKRKFNSKGNARQRLDTD